MNKPNPPTFGAFGLRSHPAQQAQNLLQQACALHQQGNLAQAKSLYEQVLKHEPKNFDALHLLGVIALQQHEPRVAVELITKALKVNREHASAYNNRGAAYAELHEHDFALLNYTKAIECNPLYAEAWNNRANVRAAMGQLDEALSDLDKALSLDPHYFQALNNRGNVLSGQGQHQEGLASFQRARHLNPDSGALQWSLGMACLRVGDFTQGWAFSEGRLEDWPGRGKGQHEQARWTEQASLEGKTILVQSEQGLGDSIQFARYLQRLVLKAARVVFEVQKPVVPLLKALEGVEIVAEGDPLPAFDCHIPLMSLPMAFHTDLSNIPPPLPILAEPQAVATWQAILGPRTRPRVGIVWSGNPAHVDDHRRSVALRELLPLVAPHIEWVSLQKDVGPADMAVLGAHPEIRHFGPQQQAFTDAAAMCELLDLVITVDTSMAHLAGSMGKPVWIMLARNPDWRWLLNRSDSPWYASAKLYRQPRHGDWATVVEQVRADLLVLFPPA